MEYYGTGGTVSRGNLGRALGRSDINPFSLPSIASLFPRLMSGGGQTTQVSPFDSQSSQQSASYDLSQRGFLDPVSPNFDIDAYISGNPFRETRKANYDAYLDERMDYLPRLPGGGYGVYPIQGTRRDYLENMEPGWDYNKGLMKTFNDLSGMNIKEEHMWRNPITMTGGFITNPEVVAGYATRPTIANEEAGLGQLSKQTGMYSRQQFLDRQTGQHGPKWAGSPTGSRWDVPVFEGLPAITNPYAPTEIVDGFSPVNRSPINQPIGANSGYSTVEPLGQVPQKKPGNLDIFGIGG